MFTAKYQAGDANPAFDAMFAKLGDAIVGKVAPDGAIASADLVHSSLQRPSGSITLFGVLTMKDYANAGGEVSGHLSSGGPIDVQGQNVEADLTFHTKAP